MTKPHCTAKIANNPKAGTFLNCQIDWQRSKVFTWAHKSIVEPNLLHKEGRGAFSGVTGGRAPSFHDLSVGEALAPGEAEGNSGGGKFPSQISHRKEQPGRLGTEEKVPRPSHECPHANTFERYQSVGSEPSPLCAGGEDSSSVRSAGPHLFKKTSPRGGKVRVSEKGSP
jgi:hypothetical protein